MKKILFLIVTFIALIGLVKADNAFTEVWNYKTGNTSLFRADQVLETKDGYLVAGTDNHSLNVMLLDNNGKKIKQIEVDDEIYGSPYKIVHNNNKYYILIYYNGYGMVVVLDEEYNQVDFKEYAIDDNVNLWNYNLPSYSKYNIYYEDENYYYVFPFKANKTFSHMDLMTESEINTLMTEAIGTDLDTVYGNGNFVFANQTINNRVLGTDAYCELPSAVLGAISSDDIKSGGTKRSPSNCYRFYTIENDTKKTIIGSNTEIVYDAIDYDDKIVALLYDLEEDEHYLVALDNDGQELSRENLEDYGVMVSTRTYLMNTANGFILVDYREAACGDFLIDREFSLECHRTNIHYFADAFDVVTKSDGHGEVAVEKVRAASGEAVKFTVTPKPGYVLSYVKVIDANGNVLTFTNNTFVMPASNVTVEAVFVPKNPNTSTGMIAGAILILLGISAVVFAKYYKKVKWLR